MELNFNQLRKRHHKGVYRLVEKIDRRCAFVVVANGCRHYFDLYGDCGSSGGDGGKGGKGGRSGYARIFELGSKSNVRLTVSDGQGGEPGQGGNDGRNPNKIRLIHETNYFLLVLIECHFWKEYSRSADETCLPIRTSSHGTNDEGIKVPEDQTEYEPAISINEFKEFARENQKNPLKRDDLVQFIGQMQNSDSVYFQVIQQKDL